MKINYMRLLTQLARRSMNAADLEKTFGINRTLISKIKKSGELRPATVGRIAKALDVDVTELLEQEKA